MWHRLARDSSMPRSRRTGRRRMLGLALGACLLPVTAMLLAGLPVDRLLDRTYGAGLQRLETVWAPVAELAPEFRLTALNAANPAQKPFIQGDRLVIDSPGRGKETIEVVATETLDGSALGLDGMTLQIVTGQPEGRGADSAVRFLFAIEKPKPEPKPNRAL